MFDYTRKRWHMSISDAESLVMEVLWERSPMTAEDVVAALADSTDWREPTVKTLLNRLLKKRAIAADRDGRRYLYRPLLKRSDYIHDASVTLLDRLFNGRVAPLVAHFSERRKLSKKDIAELKRLIGELDDGK
jgi:BlaI family transcriptional regulator, penicillinase repressor